MTTKKHYISRFINHPFVMVLPYITLFTLIILIPILISAFFSLTEFDTIQAPTFISFTNFMNLITNDQVFLNKALINTIIYALVVGVGGYILSFLLAWLLAQVTPRLRTIYTIAIYSPSITGGVMLAVIWRVMFSGDRNGYINHILLETGLITMPIDFLQNPDFLFLTVLFVGLWSSAGLGFLAMIAGVLNIDKTLYEAASIDGIRNRWQEIFYITIPSMKPQMLFGAVMSFVGAFNISGIATALSGGAVPPDYAGWMIIDHANDFGFTRFEMGYASAVTVVLFIIVIIFNRISYRLFKND